MRLYFPNQQVIPFIPKFRMIIGAVETLLPGMTENKPPDGGTSKRVIMKRSVLAIIGIGALVGFAFVINRPKEVAAPHQEPAVDPAPAAATQDHPSAGPVVERRRSSKAASSEVASEQASPPSAPSAKSSSGTAFLVSQLVDTLVSPQSTYEAKQAAWKQLKESGKLDQAIAELEQRAANDPRTAEYPAALGQAYLQKCGIIKDVREQGILAMQADKVFDTALAIDPANWDARFTKAVALSYWPANLNKSDEVIQHFTTLIQQQESQPPQPQFAETYAWLGDQYQKAGDTDEARRIWQRGAALFPVNEKLKDKLAAGP
jgi:hypothetical protein